MGSTKEQKVLRAVLEMYKNIPYLWKRDHECYTDKEVREEGYKTLLEIYQDFDDTATMKTIKKRIENLRTNYLKEWKKVLASQKAGGEEYVPCLWYFNLLNSFLHTKSESSDEIEPSENGNIKKEHGYSSIKSEGRPKRKIIKRSSYTGVSSESAKKILTNIRPKKEEPWEAYGKYLGFEIQDIEGPQLVICKKIIADAIFYAKLHRLNENSQIVNPQQEAQEYDAVEYLESD